MGRIRKRTEPGMPPEKAFWRIGKYIRLSRDDGNDVSESVIHQDQILEDEIPRFFEAGAYEVVDTYIDGPVKIGLNQKHPTARGALV